MNEESIVILPPLLVRETLLPATRTTSVDPDPDPMASVSLEKINITTFIDIQNVFDRDNEWERVYYDDGTYEMSYQYKQIPVGGFIIEF